MNPSSTAENVKNTIKSKADDVADSVYSKVDNITDATELLKRQAHKAGEKVHQWSSELRDQANDAKDHMESKIRQRPLLSAVTLFLAGVVTARVFLRK